LDADLGFVNNYVAQGIMLLRAAQTLFLLLLAVPAAQAQLPDLCQAPIASMERASGVPDRLMQAIAIIESGRRDTGGPPTAWPWTINVEGVGEVFDTKQQAIAAVAAHRAAGARSIDVGCMQVNLMHHPDAFASLEEAFDPMANARYAARFLQQLLAQTGSWPLAVAGYHSLTPQIGGDYAKKVLAIWAKPDLGKRQGTATQAAAVSPALSGGFTPALPSPSRMLSSPGGSAPAMMGRGLDAYRAMPTRLASGGPLRHS
jgi:hypothetical protein